VAQNHRGHAIIFAAPFELKFGIDTWGPASSTLPLMHNLKQQFDPQCLLNPGRFIGGI
jgi:glycolate oxidase FAD binding subunit